MIAREYWSRWAALLVAALLAGCAGTPEERDPATTSRTLAPKEVEALKLGAGMGMAAPAEINGYPGPRHVLELKDELDLTPDQRFATSRLIGQMLGQARALGQRIIEAERQLDAGMASGESSPALIKARTENIASLRAQLRFVHIDAHLKQKKILSPQQVARYYELRGRDVVVPPPAALPKPAEPLTLPRDTAPEIPAPSEPAPAPAFEVVPAPSLDETSSHEEVLMEAEPAPEETPPPVDGSELSPGMQDAMEAAEPAPVMMEETPPPLEEAATEPEVVEEAPSLPYDAVAPAPTGTLPEAAAAPGKPATVASSEKAAPLARQRRLSPGVQDAMELAEPAPQMPIEAEEKSVRIAPLDEAELEALPPEDPQEPVLIDLDN